MWIVILWLIAGLLELALAGKDKHVSKFVFVITWIVLMTQLIDNYLLT